MRALKLTVAFLGSIVLGVSAASAFIGPQDTTPETAVAAPGSDTLGDARPDPSEKVGWGVRTYASTSGGDCVELGRIAGDRFGRVDPDGSFRDLPLDQGGTCGDLGAEPAILAINSFPAVDGRPARTVLFGTVSANVADVAVTTPSGDKPVHPAIDGAHGFAVPLAGDVAPQDLPVTVTLRDGRTTTYDWR